MVPSRFECLESVEDDFITKPKQKAPKKDNVKKPEEKKTKTVAKPNKVH